mmetsp:Transcript_24255/g.67450  ORF Transcript_24255/g.67450 Transcript_24255/m.67450 type:complete len:481 (+) Transcript_24255:432-1874(+)
MSMDPRVISVLSDNELQLKRPLGRGSFGQVYLGKRKDEQGFVALKVLRGIHRKADGTPSPVDRWEEVRREWNAHLRLRGKYVVEFEEVVWFYRTKKSHIHNLNLEIGQHYLCFIMEFCCYGDLALMLSQARELRDDEENTGISLKHSLTLGGFDLRRNEEVVKFYKRPDVRLIVAQHVVAGLKRVHKQGMVHRDLRPTNIFLSEGSKEKHGYTMVALIGDFGGSRMKLEASDSYTGQQELLSVQYQAPEVIRNPDSFGPSSDVFSLGVVLWQLVTLNDPWEGMHSQYVIYQVPQGLRLTWPEAKGQIFHNYAALRELGEQCCHEDPEKRPTIEDILGELHKIYKKEVAHLRELVEALKAKKPREHMEAAKGEEAASAAALSTSVASSGLQRLQQPEAALPESSTAAQIVPIARQDSEDSVTTRYPSEITDMQSKMLQEESNTKLWRPEEELGEIVPRMGSVEDELAEVPPPTGICMCLGW